MRRLETQMAAAFYLCLHHLLTTSVNSFSPPSPTRLRPSDRWSSIARRPSSASAAKDSHDDDANDGMLNEPETKVGGNWMKKSPDVIAGIPTEMTEEKTNDATVYMDVGIGGKEFGTGPLSKRMYDVMMTVASRQFPGGKIPADIRKLYLLYSMDASAKEAVKAAMINNGYEMNLGDDVAMQDVGAWGRVERVLLLDPITGRPIVGEDGGSSYDSWEDAIQAGGWEPGDGFSFVIRRVPSLQKSMDLSSVLNALDPDGKLREEAKAKGMLLPDEDVASLRDLSVDCFQRVNSAPVEALGEEKVFRGGSSKGYNVISRDDLRRENRNLDKTENSKTLMHVMDALANHGCLIVDLTNQDKSLDDATTISKMWTAVEIFFKKLLEKDNSIKDLPAMGVAAGVGSSHAMVGYASCKEGDNQFLETRLRRSDGALLPEEARAIIGDTAVDSMVDSFRIMAEVGKDIVRIVTAAASMEAEAFVTVGSVVSEDKEGSPSIAGLSFAEASASGIWGNDGKERPKQPSENDRVRGDVLASESATLMTEEILDDGKPVGESFDRNEGPVSMSPHRICRYSNDGQSKKKTSEVFGAHTDTSFVTIVPAAAVSGLEVFDEDALQWYRPELYARKHAKGLDPTGNMDKHFPWHCRYLIVMPGELLQITSRNNVPAAVHRVVAANEAARFSAPVLLRARPGAKMDIERYMGSTEKADSLLMECNGMKMEKIHDALQVKPREAQESSN
ncbi:hypothetical protein ACHAW6_015672 [Cyclotella cf. meneghiniana]